MKTEWNMGLLYKGENDPAIERNAKLIERECDKFEKKYKGTLLKVTTPNALLPILIEYLELQSRFAAVDPTYYFSLKREVNSADTKAEEMVAILSQRLTKAENKLIFFPLFLGKLPVAFQNRILRDKQFASYRYMLSLTFENAKHNLTEAEEKILSLKSQTSQSMWINGAEKLLNKQEVVYKKKTFPINVALSTLLTLKTQKERLALSRIVFERIKSIADFAESEMNAICTDKKLNDELRGFKKPYSAMVLHNQNTEVEVEKLVRTVTDSTAIAHKFFGLKKRILGLKEFFYEDRAVSIGKVTKKISFEASVKAAKEIFESVNPLYASILKRYLENGQIDVFPKKHKSGGAFCSSRHGLPVFVMLNHNDDDDDFFTLMHEMGHAIHAERSKVQPAHYDGHTISVAEVASTLFESLAFDYLFAKASKKEQVIMLHDKIEKEIATIYRQIAFFNFELELHTAVRKKGFVQSAEIAKMYTKHLKSYLGPDTKVEELSGYGYVYVSHFRRFFYVYTYAYGILIAKTMASKYKKDKEYAKDIDHFLSLGESMSPSDIFASIGIDTKSDKVFKDGLKSIKKDVDHLETLAKEAGML